MRVDHVREEERVLVDTEGRPATLRRLDHVAIVVHELDAALDYYHGRLGLPVSREENEVADIRVAYLDGGGALLQLIQPRSERSPLWGAPEGLHHVCFSVDDVESAAVELAEEGEFAMGAGGRGRASAFLPGPVRHGVPIELNELEGA